MQKRTDQAYTYLKNAITFLATLPSLADLKFLNIGLELLYKNLQWNGVLKSPHSPIQEQQLKEVLKSVFHTVLPMLPKSKKEIFERARPSLEQVIEDLLKTPTIDIKVLNKNLQATLTKPAVLDAGWLTPHEADQLAITFLGAFLQEVEMHGSLSDVLNRKRIQIIAEKVDALIDQAQAFQKTVDDRLQTLEEALASSSLLVARRFLFQILYPPTRVVQVLTDGPGVPTQYYLTRNIEQDIIEKVERITPVLLTGMGGIGKTQLCRQLFRVYKDSRPQGSAIDALAFFQYNGDESDMLLDGLLFDRTGDFSRDRNAAWELIKETAIQRRMLILVDDIRPEQGLETSKRINLHRLLKLGCSVILASREDRVEGFHRMQILEMDEEICRELFFSIYANENTGRELTDGEQKLLKHIVTEHAGRHTMAIGLLAGSARAYSWSLDELDEALDGKGFQIVQGDSDDNVSIAFRNLYQISALGESEKNIIEAFCIFPYYPLSIHWCVVWLKEDAGMDDDKFRKTLSRLAEIRWLERSFDEISREYRYTMHEVVRVAVAEQMDCQYEDHLGLVNACGGAGDFDFKERHVFGPRWIPFALSIANCFPHVHTDCMAALYNNLARIEYLEKGNSLEAMKWQQKAMTLRETLYSNVAHPDLANSYNNLSLIYLDMGTAQEALEWQMKAMSMRETLFRDSAHPFLAGSYNNLSIIYSQLGKLSEALVWQMKAIVMYEALYCDNPHPLLADSYNNASVIFGRMNKLPEALEWILKSKAAYESLSLDEKHPSLARLYENLARIQMNMGNLEIALETELRVKKMREALYPGGVHPTLEHTYRLLSEIYVLLGKKQDAIYTARRAREIKNMCRLMYRQDRSVLDSNQ